MTERSSQKSCIGTTGMGVPFNADWTRNSRSMACALGKSFPEGCLRKTYFREGVLIR